MRNYLSPFIATIILLITSPSFGGSSNNVWLENQLNESYMRTITKHQCMIKSIDTLKNICKSDGCIKMVSGVTGDCIEWSKGTLKEFCKDYDQKYIVKYCASRYLDNKRCELLHLSNNYFCKNSD